MTQKNKESIRAFVAIHMTDEVRAKMAMAQEELKEAGARVKWIKPENIHLTLAFMGNVASEEIEHLQATLDSMAAHADPVTMNIYGLGHFGNDKSPRIIWAGVKGRLSHLYALHEQLVAALDTLHIKTDKKRFKPHITIGRIQSSKNAATLLKALKSRKNTKFGTVEAKSIALMKSELTPNGPSYSLLHESTLGE